MESLYLNKSHILPRKRKLDEYIHALFVNNSPPRKKYCIIKSFSK